MIDGSLAKFEYFCNCCGQLRLSFTGHHWCGNCHSSNIITGKLNELNKEKLDEKWKKENKE